jgi:hypothetical protein
MARHALLSLECCPAAAVTARETSTTFGFTVAVEQFQHCDFNSEFRIRNLRVTRPTTGVYHVLQARVLQACRLSTSLLPHISRWDPSESLFATMRVVNMKLEHPYSIQIETQGQCAWHCDGSSSVSHLLEMLRLELHTAAPEPCPWTISMSTAC